MVERSLSMREVPGSIPGASKTFSSTLCLPNYEKKFASSGNRTRAARVAGEHSTTEPTMLHMICVICFHSKRIQSKDLGCEMNQQF